MQYSKHVSMLSIPVYNVHDNVLNQQTELCILCAFPMDDSKYRRNVSHRDGLVLSGF